MITQKRDCIRCNRVTTHDYLETSEFDDPPMRAAAALISFGLSEIGRQVVVTRGWRCQRCRRTVWDD